MINLIEYLVIGVFTFVVIRIVWWIIIELPRGHDKNEAYCEKCWGKKFSDDVTEPSEWCECPQRDEEVDKHD